MARWVSIAQARQMRGLRLAGLRAIPSPWTEAAKGIFHVKKLACQYAARTDDEPRTALVDWAGDVGVPVVAYENERLRTTWTSILLLAERLAPEPRLLPQDADARAVAFGLSHEICGEMGLGWAYRLLMIQASLSHGPEQRGFSPGVANYLAPRYGFNPTHVKEAKRRVIDVLTMLSGRIEGKRYFLGELTAVDIYWATFANLLHPLPEPDMPFSGTFRDAYTCADPEILAAISPQLRGHQERIYREHLELPAPL